LTRLSEANNGVFPVSRVHEVIDGRTATPFAQRKKCAQKIEMKPGAQLVGPPADFDDIAAALAGIEQ
jgi:hypothetical protein